MVTRKGIEQVNGDTVVRGLVSRKGFVWFAPVGKEGALTVKENSFVCVCVVLFFWKAP